MRKSILVMAAACAASPALAEPPLHLMCSGTAVTIANPYAKPDQLRMVPHDEQIKLDFDGQGGGQIYMPMAMIPPIHDTKDGFMALRQVTFSDTQIIAKTTINFANQPKITVDRVTGSVALSGYKLTFNGRCTPYDASKAQRAF